MRSLLTDYVDAFTRADADALVELLRADAEMEMPPIPTWFTGRDAVVSFLMSRVLREGRWRLEPTRANGQPAFALYSRGADGRYQPYGVQVLTMSTPASRESRRSMNRAWCRPRNSRLTAAEVIRPATRCRTSREMPPA